MTSAQKNTPFLRILICDDNPVFLKCLREEIRKALDAHKIEATIHIFSEAEHISEEVLSKCDVFFLDIDFTGKSYTGIDVARKIRQLRKDSVIIFVTNYIEYAPEGYEVQAFRYLLKNEMAQKLEQCLMEVANKLKTEQKTFSLSISGETIPIPLNNILYIESQGHTAVLYAQKNGAITEYRFSSTLVELERQLAPQGFLRIHKSYLVNMRRLKKYQCTEAVLDNGTVLRVSAKSYAEQKKQYLLWKGRK